MTAPCDRCGIDVPARGMLCADCIDILEMTAPEKRVYTDNLIRRMNASGMPDHEIGEAIGMYARSVLRRRTQLGIPAVDKPARDFWRDPDGARGNHAEGVRAHNAKRRAA